MAGRGLEARSAPRAPGGSGRPQPQDGAAAALAALGFPVASPLLGCPHPALPQLCGEPRGQGSAGGVGLRTGSV